MGGPWPSSPPTKLCQWSFAIVCTIWSLFVKISACVVLWFCLLLYAFGVLCLHASDTKHFSEFVQVAMHPDPRDACSAIAAESYKLWLEHENRTDDITIIIVHIRDAQNVGAQILNYVGITPQLLVACRNSFFSKIYSVRSCRERQRERQLHWSADSTALCTDRVTCICTVRSKSPERRCCYRTASILFWLSNGTTPLQRCSFTSTPSIQRK
jgi:hypothetical protein